MTAKYNNPVIGVVDTQKAGREEKENFWRIPPTGKE